MSIPYYQFDTFTGSLFTGNPAGVCLLADWLPDELLQSIAAENNLAETAFLLQRDPSFDLRWFTPSIEVDLCGHDDLLTLDFPARPATPCDIPHDLIEGLRATPSSTRSSRFSQKSSPPREETWSARSLERPSRCAQYGIRVHWAEPVRHPTPGSTQPLPIGEQQIKRTRREEQQRGRLGITLTTKTSALAIPVGSAFGPPSEPGRSTNHISRSICSNR
jgi:hypothetical protein